MRLLENWQYKYIEKCLFNYDKLITSTLDTEKQMVKAINAAMRYFKDEIHIMMMREYYFKRDKYLKRYSSAAHYRYICNEIIYVDCSQGYVIRREIIYRIAMVCFELGLFKSNVHTLDL